MTEMEIAESIKVCRAAEYLLKRYSVMQIELAYIVKDSEIPDDLKEMIDPNSITPPVTQARNIRTTQMREIRRSIQCLGYDVFALGSSDDIHNDLKKWRKLQDRLDRIK